MLILWHLCVMQFGPAAPRLCSRRYEIVPCTEKMSACQTLKARNLLGMFLLVCVTVVREPHAQAGSHATPPCSLPPFAVSFSISHSFYSSNPNLPDPPLSILFSLSALPCTSLAHARTFAHAHVQWHTPCLFLRWSRLSGCYTGALMYYHISGGPCPLDKRLFNTI